MNTFGVFQTYYETGLLIQETPSNISWIGSIQAFLLLLCGLFAGPLFDMGYVILPVSAFPLQPAQKHADTF